MSNISEPNSQHTSTLKPHIHMLRGNPPHVKSWRTHHKDYSFGIDPTENTENGENKKISAQLRQRTPKPKPQKTCLGLIRLVENLRKTHHTTRYFRPTPLDPTKNVRHKRFPSSSSTTPKPNPTLKRQFEMLKVDPPGEKIYEIHHPDKSASTQQKIRNMGAIGDSCPGFSTQSKTQTSN